MNEENSKIVQSHLTLGKEDFFSSKVFLVVLAFSFIITSVILWKIQESNNLNQLYLQTEATAISVASDAEIRYRGIYNALHRLANMGAPNELNRRVQWEADANFFTNSFTGIESIAWIDKSFIIQTIVPLQDNQVFLGKTATQIFIDPSDVIMMITINNGNELEGFVLGIIDIETFFTPVVSENNQEYMFKLINEGTVVFTSENWNSPSEEFIVNQSVNLQETATLNLAFAPTDYSFRNEMTKSIRTLSFGLVFSFLTIIAVFFAQSYHKLSRLNQSRFQNLLEDVQLVTVILDLDGNITFCNDYFLSLTDWKREEVLGQYWFSKFVPPGWGVAKEIFQSSIAAGKKTEHFEHPIMTRSGDKRWLVFDSTLLWDTKGKISNISIIAKDITERKKAENDLILSQEKLKNLTQRLLNVQEQERLHLARDLHDEAGQALSVVKLRLTMLKNSILAENQKIVPKIKHLEEAIENTHEHLRAIAFSLRPPAIEMQGISKALENLAEKISDSSGLEINFQGEKIEAIDNDTAIALYRIAQESLNNILQYAGANKVCVEIQQIVDEIHLRIEDNGKGFDIEAITAEKGLGILGMVERMEYLGGSLNLYSQPGKGTIVEAICPIKDS